jgi:predicted DNA-binding transcriptional regulator YafY
MPELLFSREELETMLEGLEAIESSAKAGKAMSSLFIGLLAGKQGREQDDFKRAEQDAANAEREFLRNVQRRTLPLRAKLLDLIQATPDR